MGKKKKKKISLPHSRTMGELRRFELKTDDPKEIEELDQVIVKKQLTRRDLGVILLFLGVRSGFFPEDFGIYTRSNREHL